MTQDGAISRAVARLREGGVVAFPTETVYGLGADAFNPDAVRRVYEVKGRPAHNPLIVHVSGVEMARRVVREWAGDADRLAKEFWPGPLSIVLKKSDALPGIVTSGGASVGVRCPDHPLTLELLRAADTPLVGPSANPSGRVSPTCAAHVRAHYDESEVMVLDGGPCRGGIESTVVSLAGGEACVLRPGLVSAREIERVLGRRVSEGSREPAQGPLESPGQLLVHYAPRAPTKLLARERVIEEMALASGRVVVLSHSGLAVPGPHVSIALSGDPRRYAAGLYSAMISADEMRPRAILIEEPPEGENAEDRALWWAIRDRLVRASAKPSRRVTGA